MKVLIDINILISAAYSEGSVPHRTYNKAVEPPYHGLVCEQSIEELRRVVLRKFPNKILLFERFIETMLLAVELIPIPPGLHIEESKIRDADDRPILRAAIDADADILLSGDKDFLESAVKNPRIMSAAQFLALHLMIFVYCRLNLTEAITKEYQRLR